jgi:spermidine/putrescine transport system substrate-binding protein
MSPRNTAKLGTSQTLRAARGFNRRSVLGQAAVGAVAALGPWVLTSAAKAAKKELKIMVWSGYIPRALKDSFESRTGVTLKVTSYVSNTDLLNKLTETKGRGFDIVGPSLNRSRLWRRLGVLKPWDMKRVPTDAITPVMLETSRARWTWDGGVHHLPYLWGSEALAWRTDKWARSHEDLSYGDLWQPELKGFVMGRPYSMMVGIGLYLDHIGKVPTNRLLDSYKDEETMRRIWTEITAIAVERKPWIKLFWNNAESQNNGFMQDGVILGQTWQGPALSLKSEGKPVTYAAPREGALAWLDGLSIPIGARNIDAIYAFLEVLYTPEIGGLLASETGYNATALGAEQYLSEQSRRNFMEAYPGDALDRLWWWPPEPVWYAAARAEFRDRFVAA